MLGTELDPAARLVADAAEISEAVTPLPGELRPGADDTHPFGL